MSNLLQWARGGTWQVHRQGMVMLVVATLLGLVGALWMVMSSTGPNLTLLDFSSYQDISEGKIGMPRPRTGLVLTSDNRGQVLYGRYCDSCHPASREGIGSSLRSVQFKNEYTDAAQISAFVRKGGFDMPAYPPDFLSDEDLSAIAEYVVGLAQE